MFEHCSAHTQIHTAKSFISASIIPNHIRRDEMEKVARSEQMQVQVWVLRFSLFYTGCARRTYVQKALVCLFSACFGFSVFAGRFLWEHIFRYIYRSLGSGNLRIAFRLNKVLKKVVNGYFGSDVDVFLIRWRCRDANASILAFLSIKHAPRMLWTCTRMSVCARGRNCAPHHIT